MMSGVAVASLLGSSAAAAFFHYRFRGRILGAALAAGAAFAVIIGGTLAIVLVFGSLVGETIAHRYIGGSIMASAACFWLWISHLAKG